ncbi:rho GTPase-activating protein SYDE2 [Chanos chanos]|uniref:Rho GTPase-activating protein SYDE2 n=1 Tax=Chanos chanos TaxID=29144 RepID=A0A6J2WDA2_CHACN|nr:rho GTPase-activating protein SYDE2 [Chanos chanos]
MYQSDFSHIYHYVDSNIEETSLMRTMESFETSADFARNIRVPNLLSPSFFPTEVEICETDVASRLLCSREGAVRHHSLESEDDDYYDNEFLPFYESEMQNFELNDKKDMEIKTTQAEPVEILGPGRINSAQETDRLRSQLKEAYYLLINAMHDISFDSQDGVNEFVEQKNISNHALVIHEGGGFFDRDLCSDIRSSIHYGSQQVSDSLPLNMNESQVSCLKNSLVCKSLQNLVLIETKPALRRSVSDGAMKYSTQHPVCTQKRSSRICVSGTSLNETAQPAEADPVENPLVFNEVSRDDQLQAKKDDGQLNESSGSADSLTSSSDNGDGQGDKLDAAQWGTRDSRRHLGVTVNKMQEWMHKGRMLSSEMKQRIAGSSLRTQGTLNAPPTQEAHSWAKGACHITQGQGSKSAAPFQRGHQSALIENVHSSAPKEAGTLHCPLNTITVSKKRNWLQQSLERPHYAEEALAPHRVEEDHAPALDSSEGLGPGHQSSSLRVHMASADLSQACTDSQSHCVDPTEENDADDEGDIWYNPIPEDEEPDLPQCNLDISPQVSPQPTEPQRSPKPPQRRPSGGGEVCLTVALGTGEAQGTMNGDSGVLNATHSTETVPLQRQMFSSKLQEDSSAARVTPTDEQCFLGFSPPSSPNPSKKGGSINWSFPDKIKSPRTVRKLSMKMKKFPELSRKLSVKGTHCSNTSNGGPSQPRPFPARGSGPAVTFSSGNVISRYHLDSSVSMQHNYMKKKGSGGPKSACKRGYLSDGDSPELVTKSGKHGSSEGKNGKTKEKDTVGTGSGSSPKLQGTELDIDAFRPYSFSEQPKCTQYISGLMSLHFYGAEDLKPPRVDTRNVYCAIQVDSVNKARTALLTCRTTFLDMDHTFNIELENAQHLKLVVFSWEATPRRNRVCCHGTVVLPVLFRVTRTHQLAVRLEPRGMIYVKLNLMEQWQNSLDVPDEDREPQIFGVEAWKVVEREASGLKVPLLIDKCITEIEKRGCQVVGLYRLCGSAAVKKELREAFERDSYSVELSENLYPDINVITGVLKDYLRELPYPLISKQLYEAVLESMTKRPLRMGLCGCENDPADSEHAVSLLQDLPEVEKVTLRRLLDHLKLVASHHEVNKMTCQNLAVCFGPVLLSQRQDASCHSNRVFIDSEELASALHFKKHIEVLHYLLQLWPVVDSHGTSSPLMTVSPAPALESTSAAAPLRRRKDRPQVLKLSEAEKAGVLRPRPGRLDSPSNRYAGDWSSCRGTYLQQPRVETDSKEVPIKSLGSTEEVEGQRPKEGGDGGQVTPEVVEEREKNKEKESETRGEERRNGGQWAVEKEHENCDHILPTPNEHCPREHAYQAYVKIQEISPVLSNRVNLRDLQESIDTLIGNLERELNKNKLNVGY